MKNSVKSVFTVILAAILLFALSAPAFAAPDEGGYVLPGPVVHFPYMDDLNLKIGEDTSISALVSNADPSASYDWYSSTAGVVSLSGSKESATINALKEGHTEITLLVTNPDGQYDSDTLHINVTKPASPITVSGGGNISLNVGDTSKLSAIVTGGSGQYSYTWDTDGSSAVFIYQNVANSADIYAGNAGTGTVFLTVYDELDYSNNATVQWNFTVEAKQQATAPTVELSRGTIDLGAGSTASLSLMASGGSGKYEYYWQSDNSGIVSVTPSGTNAELRATTTLLPGSNTAQISATVYDKETGLISEPAVCVVTVTGQSTTHDYYGEATVGKDLLLSEAAEEIDLMALADFGVRLSGTASIKFESTTSTVGSILYNSGTAIRAGTSYNFDSVWQMVFRGTAAGAFNTRFWIVDGAYTVSGKLSIGVSGGIGITGASLNATSLRIPTYSSQYLRVNVTPSNANYRVTWTSLNTGIVTVSGSGNQVTVKSGGKTGKATVIASVADANNKAIDVRCEVTVYEDSSSSSSGDFDPSAYYNMTLSLTLGSDYYGTKLADSLTDKFKSVFGYYPSEYDTIRFPRLGDSRYGTMYLQSGSAVQTNRNYTLRDWVDMYFVPSAVGTYELSYELTHGSNTMRGAISIYIQASSMTVTMSPAALQMSPYSSQYLNLSVNPIERAYRITWTSSNSRVATVSGNNTSAVVNSAANGTAVITAIVTDGQGVEIRRSCTVMVNSSGSVFNPSASTTLGIPYTGTGTSDALRNQFQSVYGFKLQDNATIRFASTGNTEVAVLRLSDGSMIRANTDYTLSQYVAMYVQPVAAGTYSVPYTLSYSGKSLTGTISFIVSPSSISTNITLSSDDPYQFSSIVGGTTGGVIFADSIRNSCGTNWSYLRFTSSSNSCGTLYLNSSRNQITPSTNITAQNLSSLYFVPGTLSGTFSAPYTIYTANGTVVGAGTLNIARPGQSFNDVNPNIYYAQAVSWAVNKGVTSGTGGNNFSPDMTVTRGQAVTFLWRAAGQPKFTSTANPFKDVKSGAYYYDAVIWAVQQGITQGTSATTFSPDAQLNRDQLLTFLCRSSGGYAGGSDWSKQAVDWARSAGLLDGVPGVFVANSACPRCDVVYYIWKNSSR